jgi:hypothetical protein
MKTFFLSVLFPAIIFCLSYMIGRIFLGIGVPVPLIACILLIVALLVLREHFFSDLVILKKKKTRKEFHPALILLFGLLYVSIGFVFGLFPRLTANADAGLVATIVQWVIFVSMEIWLLKYLRKIETKAV